MHMPPRGRISADQRLLQDAGTPVGAVLRIAARFALDLLLIVSEQFRELGERVAAAEIAEQIDRRATHGRIRRALQSFDLPPADRTERDQNGGQALARPRALLGREGFGERPDQHLADRHTHGLDPLELRVVDVREVVTVCI